MKTLDESDAWSCCSKGSDEFADSSASFILRAVRTMRPVSVAARSEAAHKRDTILAASPGALSKIQK